MAEQIACGVCTTPFLPKMHSQKYCSRLCYTRSWAHNHREEHNEKSRLRRLAKPQWYAAREPGYYRGYRAKLLSSKPWKYLLTSRRRDAEKRGIVFELTDEWAKARWNGCCEITGIAFRSNGKQGPHPFSPSIDRIQNDEGYTLGNSRFILWGCNAIKGVGTDADMYEIAKAISDRTPI